MKTLQEIVSQSSSIQELDLPNAKCTWKQLMEAIAAGAIDDCEIEEMLEACAALADEAVAARPKPPPTPGMADITPTWAGVMALAMRHMPEIGDGLASEIIRCGEIADAWEAKQLQGVPS